MTQLLRKLENRRNWDRADWLADGDCPADAVHCLRPQHNALSVYLVQNRQVERVVAALALTRDNLANLDFAVADLNVLAEHGIESNATPGTTPDGTVNDWHQDLVELSISKLAGLATAILANGKIRRLQKAAVKKAIKSSIDGGYVDTDKLKPNMLSSLRKQGLI